MLNYSLCQDGLLHRLCMVDPTSLLWSVRNPFHFIVCAWLIVPALYERQDTKKDILAIQSTCIKISVCLLCSAVPKKTTAAV